MLERVRNIHYALFCSFYCQSVGLLFVPFCPFAFWCRLSSLPCVICTFSPNDPNKLVPFVYGAMRFGMFGLGSSALCSSVPRSSILRTAYLVSSCFSPFSNEITSIKFRAPYLGLTLDNEGITWPHMHGLIRGGAGGKLRNGGDNRASEQVIADQGRRDPCPGPTGTDGRNRSLFWLHKYLLLFRTINRCKPTICLPKVVNRHFLRDGRAKEEEGRGR